MAALSAILVENDSQFIIATHSPILLAYPRARIYQFSESGINEIRYEDTDHYSVTREFLNNHDEMLKILMGLETSRMTAATETRSVLQSTLGSVIDSDEFQRVLNQINRGARCCLD